MEWLSPVMMAVQVISALSVIVLVLLQQGKGADMGSAFGSGSAGSLFGAAGAANFLSRTTKWAAILFFVSTAGLAWLSHTPAGKPDAGVMQGFEVPQAPGAVPSVPGSNVPAAGSVPASSAVPATPAPAAPQASSADATANQAPAAAAPAAQTPAAQPAASGVEAPVADAPASEPKPSVQQ